MSESKRPQKAVIDGKPTYTSASSLQKAKDCPRKWYFDKVLGHKPPASGSQSLGKKIHSQIENYLKTGDVTLGPIALSGKHLIPEPDPSYLIEHRIWDSGLKAAGIPIEGYIDLVVPPAPGEAVEVIDWKTTSNMRWAKTGQELPKTIQMSIYAEWARRTYKPLAVRLSHVYFQTRGLPKARKSTVVVPSGKIISNWELVEDVARSLHQYAEAESVEDVPANRDACDNYGGCPFFAKCPRTMKELFTVDNKLKRAWENIRAAGRGMPPIEGSVARELLGVDSAGGSGELAKLPPLSDEDTVLLLADELQAENPPLLPPDAPKSDPKLAADEVEKPVPEGVVSVAEAKKLNKGPLMEAYEQCYQVLMSHVDTGIPTETRDTLYVNCVPPQGLPSLESYVYEKASELASNADAPDIRCSDNPLLGFGKWKGALAAALREDPPKGSYTVVCKGDDLVEVAVNALRDTHDIVRGF